MIEKRNNQDTGFHDSNTSNSKKARIPADIISMLILSMIIFGYVLYKDWQQFATPPWYLVALIIVVVAAYAVSIWLVCSFYLIDKREK